MKRRIIFLAVFITLTLGVCIASADTLARDAMITYSGTDAFTKLTSMERQACVDWLVHGGTMSERCSKAVMKLTSMAPNEVTAEQRQALIAEASGVTTAETAQAQTEPQTQSEQPQIVKKEDNTGKYVAIGLLGVLAGLVIHNNVGHHKAAPSYNPPAPPRNNPPRVEHRAPQPPRPQQVSRPVYNRQPQQNRPPHR